MLYTRDLGEDEKARFLELLEAGYGEQIAAEECGSTATQFRRLRNPEGAHHDAEFTAAFAKAKEAGDLHYQELLRAKNRELALKGQEAALKRESLVHLPEYEPLRHANFRHQVDIDVVLRRALPALDEDEIARNIEALEARLKDAQVGTPALRMLPPASEA